MTENAQAIVHLAVYDTLADWEVGFATAHINKPSVAQDAGAVRGEDGRASLEPITTMGGLRVDARPAIADLSPLTA